MGLNVARLYHRDQVALFNGRGAYELFLVKDFWSCLPALPYCDISPETTLVKLVTSPHVELGAYRLLMDAYWDNGGPLPLSIRPDFAESRARPSISWAAIEATIFPVFSEKTGCFSQKLDEELCGGRVIASSARAKGTASGASRWGAETTN